MLFKNSLLNKLQTKVLQVPLLKLLCVVGFMFILATCTFDKPNVNDSYDPNVPYSYLKTRPYMGGSVLYLADGNHQAGHLQDGKIIAIRVGKVTAVNGSYKHIDNDDTNYGYIKIISVTDSNISFKLMRYGGGGKFALPAANFGITSGGSIDITGDGVPDLSYGVPDYPRPGMYTVVDGDVQHSARYLSFLSSKAARSSTMFSVLPEQYGGTYPNGLVGITDTGSFIAYSYQYKHNVARGSSGVFLKYDVSGGQDSNNKLKNAPHPDISSAQSILGLKKGDYVIEAKNDEGASIPVMVYVYEGFHSTKHSVGGSTLNKTKTRPFHTKIDGDGNIVADDNPDKIPDAQIYEDAKFTTDDYNNDFDIMNKSFVLMQNWIYGGVPEPDWWNYDGNNYFENYVSTHYYLPPWKEVWDNDRAGAWGAFDDTEDQGYKNKIIEYYNELLTNGDFIENMVMANWAAAEEPEAWSTLKTYLPEIRQSIVDEKKGEVAALVRSAMQLIKKEGYFPTLHLNPDEVTQALPQHYLNVTDNYDYYTDPNYNGNASGYNDYITKRDAAQNDYNTYMKNIHTFDIESIFTGIKSMSGNKIVPASGNTSSVSLGLTGSASCCWGNIDLQIGAGLFMVLEADMSTGSVFSLDQNYKANLTKGVTAHETFGPVVLDITVGQIDVDMDMEFKITQVPAVAGNHFAGYAGFWGGKAQVGVNYSVGFKWGFIPDSLTLDPYASAKKWNETTSYVGPKKAATGDDVFGAEFKFTPSIAFTNKVSLWSCPYAEIVTTLGLPITMDAQLVTPYFKLDGDLTLSIDADEGFEMDVLIWHKKWDLAKQNIYKNTINLFDITY
ncbi:MAG: hypothetical protein Ta2B_25140 [Termitinemataceae bacterium]|nr:MAG: hypothetical protein Ta2B_25140 [Termitinemataceae bacterium]